MESALLSMDGLNFIFRWIHFLAGVAWIGLLYYFNFVQGEWFKEIDAATKNQAIAKLVPRALWWFRWAAMATFLTGWLIIGLRGHIAGDFGIFATSWGISILTGASLGTLMFLNVWLVIWPNQKVVIASATQLLAGGKALPDAASCAAKAGLSSRHNVLFSIPMLFFMGFSSHLNFSITSEVSLLTLLGTVWVILAALELNSLKGKLGPLTSVKGVIHMGLALTVVLYGILEVLT